MKNNIIEMSSLSRNSSLADIRLAARQSLPEVLKELRGLNSLEKTLNKREKKAKEASVIVPELKEKVIEIIRTNGKA